MTSAIITNPYILIKPSKSLCDCIKKLDPELKMPNRIKYLFLNKNVGSDIPSDCKNDILLSSEDYEYLNSLEEKCGVEDLSSHSVAAQNIDTFPSDNNNYGFLRTDDLLWLYHNLNDRNLYLHDLLKNSIILVPENKKVERNPELEKRCEQLKIQHENKLYKTMTKNVDNIRIRHSEDTIGFQRKFSNLYLIMAIILKHYRELSVLIQQIRIESVF